MAQNPKANLTDFTEANPSSGLHSDAPDDWDEIAEEQDPTDSGSEESGPVIVEFTRELIEKNWMYKEFSTGKLLEYPGRQVWFVSGYDNTPEEIYQIEEVREYMQRLHRDYPGWMLHLNFDSFHNIGIIFCLLPTPPRRIENALAFNKLELGRWLEVEFSICAACVRNGLFDADFVDSQFSKLQRMLGAGPSQQS